MAKLALRHEQLSAAAYTQRLFRISSCVGIISLTGVCIAVLPWGLARTQGDWVAFAVVAASTFVWTALPIAASGQLRIRRRLLSAWWCMLVAAAAHLALAIYLERLLINSADSWIQECVDLDRSVEECSTRSNQLLLAYPITAACLELGAIPLLWLLRRSFDRLPNDHIYDTIMDDDLPPGWHDPPAELAADSSASDPEDEESLSAEGARRVSRTRVGSGTDKDSASEWYELGRASAGHRSSRNTMRAGPRWSDVRQARKERNLARAGTSSGATA